MILHIINETTLHDVQLSFSKAFPYLKLEIVTGIKEENITDYNPGLQIKKIQKKKLFPNLLQIQPWYKYVEVKNVFKNMFGITIKLLRRKEENWIEASYDLPVEELNRIAKHSTEYYLHIKREKQVHIW